MVMELFVSLKHKIKNVMRYLRVKYISLKILGKPDIQIRKRILILAPHPDDESIGCCGLIQRAIKERKDVYIIILTDGSASLDNYAKNQIINERRSLARNVADRLNITKLFFLDFPDGKMRLNHPEVEKLHTLMKEIHPEQVFIPSHLEGWSDHVIVKRLIKELWSDISEVYEYCVWFWYYFSLRIDWKSTYVLRMTRNEHRNKKRILEYYTSSLSPQGNPWIGVLPSILLRANIQKDELYFKIK